MEDLLFRRQFILTSEKIQSKSSWIVSKLNKFYKDCYIYSHPDLELSYISDELVELFLLGYILDPFHPERSNQEVLVDLLKSDTYDDLILNTETLGGRFVIIYSTKDIINVFQDATGFREVYYYQNKNEFACGSTPNILANYLSIDKDDENEINHFFNSSELNKYEKCWIGTRSIYKGVMKLLPNHYLDLVNMKVHRFWPNNKREIKSLREVSQYIAKIVSGTYDSAIIRYQLNHSITSGWDSRLMLACARRHIHNMQFYFYRGFKNDIGKDSDDFIISKKISTKFQLSTDFIRLDNVKLDEEFEKIYFSNNIMSRPKLLNAYYDAYIKKLSNTVTVSGTMGNEILRIKSSLNRKADKSQTYAKMIRYEKFPYVIRSIDEWLDSARYLKEKHYVLIDLFFWEQYFGNWGSLSATEQDIVREELRPFNNRALISAVLSLKDKYRYRDYPLIYVRTIQLLCPELLKFKMDMKNYTLKKVLRFFGLEQLTDRLYHSLKTK